MNPLDRSRQSGDPAPLGAPHAMPTRTMSITDLEAESGIPRSSIYYYRRRGILFPAQTSGRSWAVYTDRHLRRLEEIRQLKAEGRTVSEIRRLLIEEVSAPSEQIDLIALKAQETRNFIVETAIRHFISKGYRNTRIVDITDEVGMLAPIFYRFFLTKRQLFLEAVDRFTGWMLEFLEPQLAGEEDIVVRHMTRVRAFLRLRSLGPDPLTFIRAEALNEDEESARIMESTYRKLVQLIVNDLTTIAESVDDPSRPCPEMVAYGLQGVLEGSAMRLSWGAGCSDRDYYHTNLRMFLAAQAIYTGKNKPLSDYDDLIDRLVGSIPPSPPRLAEWLRDKAYETSRRPSRPPTTGDPTEG